MRTANLHTSLIYDIHNVVQFATHLLYTQRSLIGCVYNTSVAYYTRLCYNIGGALYTAPAPRGDLGRLSLPSALLKPPQILKRATKI